jgi:hypothetical protein
MSTTPIGDAAREATASPYIGEHRAAEQVAIRYLIDRAVRAYVSFHVAQKRAQRAQERLNVIVRNLSPAELAQYAQLTTAWDEQNNH